MVTRHFAALLIALSIFLAGCGEKPDPPETRTPTFAPTDTHTAEVEIATTTPARRETATPTDPDPAPTLTRTPTPTSEPTTMPEPGFYSQLVAEYAHPIADIPEELKTGNVAFSPIFRNVPGFQALRDGMIGSEGDEKWTYVAQIVARIGVQTREELGGQRGPASRVERWHVRDDNGRRLRTCNIYAATVLHALGMGEDMSHWFSPQGVPQFNEGIEYQARQTQRWLQDRGEEFGWQDVSQISLDERLGLIENGYILLGANQVHMWLVFGAMDGDGQVVPVLTQSTPNTLFVEPSRWQFQRPSEGTLFAHRLP